MTALDRPVVILGAGINGAALARELALNRVPVVVVDKFDVSYGTTAYSSRLIHGGLRYLEFGDVALVRESLAERARLLQLAPQFVRPLRLYIPARGRLGGWLSAAKRFLLPRSSGGGHSSRGMWLINTGLKLYDYFAAGSKLSGHSVHRVGQPGLPAVDPNHYSWLCSYSDAQMRFPERFVMALLNDAQTLAADAGVSFRVLTYHRAHLNGRSIEIKSVRVEGDSTIEQLEPAAIVNATGAWVDLTLRDLPIASPRFMAGTKGSHLVTFHPGLVAALSGQAVYVEADDGRPVFVLPFGNAALIGTTDIQFSGPPEEAVATDDEINYLLTVVNEVFPEVRLSRADIELHYCGVRPLPATSSDTPAAVTRRHKIEENTQAPLPCYSLIGGKLTTCRALAEEAADTLLARLSLTRINSSRDRIIDGGENFPATDTGVAAAQADVAREYGLSLEQVAAAWPLFGTRLPRILSQAGSPPWDNVADTALPTAVVRWVIDHEWVATLDDLVERRLMLLYHRPLTTHCLRQLAELVADAGRIGRNDVDREVQKTIARLRDHFGKQVALDVASRSAGTR